MMSFMLEIQGNRLSVPKEKKLQPLKHAMIGTWWLTTGIYEPTNGYLNSYSIYFWHEHGLSISKRNEMVFQSDCVEV